jgi:hypothetical protein
MRHALVLAVSLLLAGSGVAADWRNDRLKEIQAALDANEASRAQYCTFTPIAPYVRRAVQVTI